MPDDKPTPKIEIAPGYRGTKIKSEDYDYRQIISAKDISEQLKDPQKLDLFLWQHPELAYIHDPDESIKPVHAENTYNEWREILEIHAQGDSRSLDDDAVDVRNKSVELMYGMEGYDSTVWNETAANFRNEHFKDDKWDSIENQNAYQNIQQRYTNQKDWEAGNVKLHREFKKYNDYRQQPLPVDSNFNPIIEFDTDRLKNNAENSNVAAHFLIPSTAERQTYPEWRQQQRQQIQSLATQGNLDIRITPQNHIMWGSKKAIAGIRDQIVNPIKPGAALSEARKKAIRSATKRAVIEASKGLAAKTTVSLLTGGTAAAIMALSTIGNILKQNKLKGLALLTYLTLQISTFLKALFNPSTFISTAAGAIMGGSVGGASGAVAGGIAGFTGERAVFARYGSTTGAIGEGAHSLVTGPQRTIIDANSGQIVNVAYRHGGIMDIIAPGAPGTIFYAISVLAPFGLAMIFTFITMTVIFTSFTVPYPQAPDWGTPGTSNVPGLPAPGPQPGTPGSGPGPAPGQNAYNGPLSGLILDASRQACMPAAFLTAVLQVEAGGSFGFDQAQITRFDTYGWWQNAQPGGVNCYNGNQSGECRTAYCYNTCAGVDGTSDICLPLDVRGPAQFLSTTFYGSQACTSPEGIGSACKNPNYPAHYIATKIRNDETYIANRCLLSDAIYGSAFYLAKRSQSVTFSGNDYSCTYESNRWDPNGARDSICRAARAYCGSCGMIESPSHPQYNSGLPCEGVYGGNPSANCGGSNSIGYCNLVYNNYIENLSQ